MFFSLFLGKEYLQQDLEKNVDIWIPLKENISRCAAITIITRKMILI